MPSDGPEVRPARSPGSWSLRGHVAAPSTRAIAPPPTVRCEASVDESVAVWYCGKLYVVGDAFGFT